MGLLEGDIADLDLRRSSDLLLRALMGTDGRSAVPLLDAVAARDPAVLAEILLGPRAIGGRDLGKCTLRYCEILERVLGAQGFYRRLIEISGEIAGEIFEMAVARHPEGSWLVGLAARGESLPGKTQLLALQSSPRLGEIASLHAVAGHKAALMRVALDTGRPELLAALVVVDAKAAMPGCAAFLDQWLEVPLIPYLAEAWGPDIDSLLKRLVPHLVSRRSIEAVESYATHAGEAMRLLQILKRGVR